MNVRVQLPNKWVKYLVHQPESGMGYQRVDVVLEDGTTLVDCFVFNADEIEIPDTHASKRIKEMHLRIAKNDIQS
jgi:hypothetical protein